PSGRSGLVADGATRSQASPIARRIPVVGPSRPAGRRANPPLAIPSPHKSAGDRRGPTGFVRRGFHSRIEPRMGTPRDFLIDEARDRGRSESRDARLRPSRPPQATDLGPRLWGTPRGTGLVAL